jgi:hypothetical protein
LGLKLRSQLRGILIRRGILLRFLKNSAHNGAEMMYEIVTSSARKVVRNRDKFRFRWCVHNGAEKLSGADIVTEILIRNSLKFLFSVKTFEIIFHYQILPNYDKYFKPGVFEYTESDFINSFAWKRRGGKERVLGNKPKSTTAPLPQATELLQRRGANNHSVESGRMRENL